MTGRAIVNYGVYIFTPEERVQRVVRLFTEVERFPDQGYVNQKFQKSQGFYGYAQVMAQGVVCSTVQLQYERELIFSWENSEAQRQISHYCTEQNVRTGLGILISALEASPLGPPYPIPEVASMIYDRVVFKLFGNTTLLVECLTESFINICNAPIAPVNPPAIPQPSSRDIPSNPIDEPYDVPDAPYELSTADNGETYNPQVPPVPEGESGRIYNLEGRFTAVEARLGNISTSLAFASVIAPYYPPVLFRAEQRASGLWYWGIRIQHAGGEFLFDAFSNGESPNVITAFTMEYLNFIPRP